MTPELDAFLTRLAEADAATLILDYDGTLAPFRVDRIRALPYGGVVPALDRLLTDSDTRVVIVSGRALDDLLPLLKLAHPPEIWGSHGWERLGPEGRRELAPLDDATLAALDTARAAAAAEGLADRFEAKPASVACHWRGLVPAARRALRERCTALWSPLLANAPLELHEFDGGIELRVRGLDKGTTVEEVLASQPADAATAYLGDDATDEDAFRALKGRGLGVLVRSEHRDTAADAWIRPPAQLIEFLDAWHAVRKARVPPTGSAA